MSVTTPHPMARVFDLSIPGIVLPARVVVDTSLVIPHLLPGYHAPHPQAASRATRFFSLRRLNRTIGLVTSIGLNEIFHFAIASKYRSEIPSHVPALMTSYPAKRRFDWLDLYKIDGSILQRFVTDLERLCRLLTANGLVVVQPADLRPIASGRPIDAELIYLIGRFGLDTNDAAILLEAQRIGVLSIATLDRDMQRAQADFDVYTWL